MYADDTITQLFSDTEEIVFNHDEMGILRADRDKLDTFCRVFNGMAEGIVDGVGGGDQK